MDYCEVTTPYVMHVIDVVYLLVSQRDEIKCDWHHSSPLAIEHYWLLHHVTFLHCTTVFLWKVLLFANTIAWASEQVVFTANACEYSCRRCEHSHQCEQGAMVKPDLWHFLQVFAASTLTNVNSPWATIYAKLNSTGSSSLHFNSFSQLILVLFSTWLL